MISPVLLKYNTEGKIRVGDIVDVMKEYAKQVAEETLKDALDRAEVDYMNGYNVEPDSILLTPIQLP